MELLTRVRVLNPEPYGPQVHTASGWPAVSTPVLRQLAGKPGAALAALAKFDASGAA